MRSTSETSVSRPAELPLRACTNHLLLLLLLLLTPPPLLLLLLDSLLCIARQSLDCIR